MNTNTHHNNIGSVPIFTPSQPCRPKDSVRLNQLGINLMSKFSCVGQNSNTHPGPEQTQPEDFLPIAARNTQELQSAASNAFTPQANDDFCSSEDESDSDYNPFEYPG
ncbi:hypothetical protein L195_g045617 [Trifolium pratense]|uniref:Uncharacterized protein n=1 Tax=Trifolium pratense TaxID=57577 RepID=A0A2K3MFD5_TRIPR|nr:hypothetical protein L195_g045617 [Trifolium pratense]